MKQRFIMAHQIARQRAIQAVTSAPDGYVVTVSEPTRTIAQNDHMWAVLTELSRQVDWYGQRLTKEEWKDVITAALKGQKVVPGISGGFVVTGTSTSRMSIKEMIDVIDFAYAFGADRSVTFQEAAA